MAGLEMQQQLAPELHPLFQQVVGVDVLQQMPNVPELIVDTIRTLRQEKLAAITFFALTGTGKDTVSRQLYAFLKVDPELYHDAFKQTSEDEVLFDWWREHYHELDIINVPYSACALEYALNQYQYRPPKDLKHPLYTDAQHRIINKIKVAHHYKIISERLKSPRLTLILDQSATPLVEVKGDQLELDLSQYQTLYTMDTLRRRIQDQLTAGDRISAGLTLLKHPVTARFTRALFINNDPRVLQMTLNNRKTVEEMGTQVENGMLVNTNVTIRTTSTPDPEIYSSTTADELDPSEQQYVTQSLPTSWANTRAVESILSLRSSLFTKRGFRDESDYYDYLIAAARLDPSLVYRSTNKFIDTEIDTYIGLDIHSNPVVQRNNQTLRRLRNPVHPSVTV